MVQVHDNWGGWLLTLWCGCVAAMDFRTLPTDIVHLIKEFIYGDNLYHSVIQARATVIHQLKSKILVTDLNMAVDNATSGLYDITPSRVLEYNEEFPDELTSEYFVINFWQRVLNLDYDTYMVYFDQLF